MTIADLSYFLNLNDSSLDQEEKGEVCIANISPVERQKRLRFGIWQFIVTVAILGIMIVLGLNPFCRFPPFIPVLGGSHRLFSSPG